LLALPPEKAKLLNIPTSNCLYKDGKISREWRKPFNLRVSEDCTENVKIHFSESPGQSDEMIVF
jgi:hypothetical protein